MAGQEPDEAHPAIQQAFELRGDPERIVEYYDEWAATYDSDVAGEVYGVPSSCVAVLRRCIEMVEGFDDPEISILDAGCGTGLVGAALAAAGFTNLHGVDLSPGMVAAARARGVYRRLVAQVDLAEPPPDGWAHDFDVMVIGGVYTLGHLPPTTLADMPRWIKPGGMMITSVRDAYYDAEDYQTVSDGLVAAGRLTELLHAENLPYTMDSTGHYFAYLVG
ncbi:MAG: class I SAM-dependent methyltransferase [Ilumatobacter sp.]|nr:class I SAM-dependent methyltransferase [Ilumatobacter sp.]